MHYTALGCRTMGDAIVVAIAFFVLGGALLLTGQTLVPETPPLRGVVQGLGMLLLLFVPFILLSSYARTHRDDHSDQHGEQDPDPSRQSGQQRQEQA